MKRVLIALAAVFLLAATASAQNNPFYTRGYAPSVQVGYSVDETYHYWSLETSHGYSFGQGLYAGGGVGMHFMPDLGEDLNDVYMGVCFGDVKYSFLNRLISPFVGARVGIYYDFTDSGHGLMTRPYAGVDIWKFSLSVALDQHFMYYSSVDRVYAGWLIQLAFNF